MSVPLGILAARKSDAARSGYVGPAEALHREEVRKAKARNEALNAFRPHAGEARKTDNTPSVRSSNGRQSIMGGTMLDEISGTATTARKTQAPDANTLHPKVRAYADKLTPDAARLFDLVLKTNDMHKGGQLIQLPAYDIAKALGIPECDAQSARTELERRSLIRFFDDYSGDRGYRPASSL